MTMPRLRLRATSERIRSHETADAKVLTSGPEHRSTAFERTRPVSINMNAGTKDKKSTVVTR